MNYTYGNITVDTDKLPAPSIAAMLSRGLSHFLGNEQASKVAAKFKDDTRADDDATLIADKAKYKAECQANAMTALTAGTVGESNRGPRGSTIDTVIRGLAKDEVIGVLKTLKLTFPTGEKQITFGEGENVQNLTGAELIDRRIVKHGDRLRKEAEAKMKKLAKVAEVADL